MIIDAASIGEKWGRDERTGSISDHNDSHHSTQIHGTNDGDDGVDDNSSSSNNNRAKRGGVEKSSPYKGIQRGQSMVGGGGASSVLGQASSCAVWEPFGPALLIEPAMCRVRIGGKTAHIRYGTVATL